MLRTLGIFALGLAAVAFMPARAKAVWSSQDGKIAVARVLSGNDRLEARQYRLPEARVAGQEAMRQSVTVWEVTSGTWNGVSLQGLSLVLVNNTPDNGQSRPITNCYISYLADAAQREALLSAFLAAQNISPGDISSWRVEPAVIRFEIAGGTVVVHLGLIA